MEFSKEELQKAASMSNDQFAAIIYAVMTAAGASKAEASAAMMQAASIKRRLASASDAELKKLTRSLPPETVASIKESLKAGEKNGAT